jgi:glc operon protein GlcG
MALTIEQARTIVAAAQERARDLGLAVSVAVVDGGGVLQAFERMDGAPPLSAQIAEAKAVGSALWHRDGDAMATVQDQRPAFFEAVGRLPRLPLMPADGSVVLRDGGGVLGAVGVSGAKPEQDRECADAGAAALGG